MSVEPCQAVKRIGRVFLAISLVAMLGLHGGCLLDEQTPGNAPGGTTSGTSGSTAKCSVSQGAAPAGVPVEAISLADDAVAEYGTGLNEFWKLNSCVFRGDPSVYSEIQQNAISFSQPPVVIYDPALFQRFAQEWGSDLPTELVVAHEWGHQVQYANNAQYSTSFEYEQDADMRAGYYLGTLAQRLAATNLAEIADFLQRFACSTGDPDSVPWFTEGAHGSCEQRANAVVSGFNEAVRTSTLGRRALSQPGAWAAVAGTWSGNLTVSVTIIDDAGIVVSDSVPTGYYFTIDTDGKVIDDMGSGPVPDVGETKTTPVQEEGINITIVATVTQFSFDDTAARYEMDLRVDAGTIGGVSVTGTGFENDLYSLRSDGRLNLYIYQSLTLTGDSGASLTLVVEAIGIMTRL